MRLVVALPVVGTLLILCTGLAISVSHARVTRIARRFVGWSLVARGLDAWREQRGHLIRGFGPGLTAALIISAAIPPIVFLTWALGIVGKHNPVWPRNEALFSWFMREGDVTWLTHTMRIVTQAAEWDTLAVVTPLAAVALFFYAPSRRWLAPFLFVIAVVAERYLQKSIATLVNETHPPTSLADYPSGGAARAICVYGFLVFLYLRLRGRSEWSLAVSLWTTVGLLAFLLGYARAYLLLHWPIDILGGWLLGAMLLAMMIAASSVLEIPSRQDVPRSTTEPHLGDRADPATRAVAEAASSPTLEQPEGDR